MSNSLGLNNRELEVLLLLISGMNDFQISKAIEMLEAEEVRRHNIKVSLKNSDTREV